MRARTDGAISRLVLLTSVALPASLMISPALAAAQPADRDRAGQAAESNAQPTQGGDIVVTAQRREQSLQDVPASVTAISGQALERRGAEDFEDYARGVPGLAFSVNTPGQTKLTMRGIPNLGGSGATVSVYVDEISTTGDDGRTGLSDVALYDVDRVEILRGPQGTLYGASSMGGAIRIITTRPDLNDFSVRFQGLLSQTAHSDNANYGAQGVINIPLAQDVAALRVAGFHRRYAGFVDRVPNQALLANGVLTAQQRAQILAGAEDINEIETTSFRATGLLRIGDNVELTPLFMLTDNDWASQSTINPALGGGLVNDVPVDEPFHDHDRQAGLTAEINLGPARLISATSYTWRRFSGAVDQSAAFNELLPFVISSNVGIFTQEVRLQSSGEHRLNWLIGAFYRNFDEEGGADLTNSGGTALFVKEATRDQWEIAGFADATYDITSALHANVGVRIYKGRQRRFDFDRGLFVGGSRTTAGDSRYDGINPRLSLSYDVNDDVMLYATAAKGYRAGGPNTPIPVPRCAADLATLGLTQGPAGFGPDSLWNYEVGARTSLANRRLTINGAAYVIKWRDIQLRQPLPTCGFDFGTNAGAATSTGVEVELTAHPAHNLELTASLGYADAQLDETLPGIPGSRAGARVPYVPKWTFGASASYTIPVTSSLSARLDSNYQFTSRYRTNLLAPSVRNRADPVNTWNASVTAVGRHWEAGVFVDNILDDRPVVGSNGSSAVIQYTVPRPRTIGLRVTGNF